MRKLSILAFAALIFAACNKPNEQTMQLTQEWDKKFPKSEKVEHKKVTFHNRFGITLAADYYALLYLSTTTKVKSKLAQKSKVKMRKKQK